ncbi:TRAP transporter small permease [Ramlibacter sp. 2FC]|uniref:TRAP transporter small permease n=1 Tax=Ramlibacter sp. 2FC TaxID=2502188 RepID=UPI0010F5DA3D|nr:TRAP transporter small permease [Ramlibacter sp. 2FC]
MNAITMSMAPAPAWPDRVLRGLDQAVTGLLLAAVAAMVGVVSAQVALRYGFNRSIDWADEIGRLAFVWSIFLAIPLAVRQGGHIGIDIVSDKLPEAWRGALKRAGAAVCALMMFAIAWAALGVAREQWDELMATLDWSVGWFIVPVGIGALLSALHLLRIVVVGPPAAQLGAAE